MKHISTKKIIALAVIATICILAIIQGIMAAMVGDYQNVINSGVLAMGSSITGFYYGYGKGKDDSGDGNV